jgi:hypothetical protein
MDRTTGELAPSAAGRAGSVGKEEKVGRHVPKSREGRRQAVVPAVHRPTEALGDRIQELRLPPLGGNCRPRRQEQQEAAAECEQAQAQQEPARAGRRLPSCTRSNIDLQ